MIEQVHKGWREWRRRCMEKRVWTSLSMYKEWMANTAAVGVGRQRCGWSGSFAWVEAVGEGER